MRSLAAKCLPGDISVIHMGVLHDTRQSWSKLGRFGLVCGWYRRAAASMDNITKSIISMQRAKTLLLALCQGQLYMQKIQPSMYRSMPLPRTVSKLHLFIVYVGWLLLYCKLENITPWLFEICNFSKLIFLKIILIDIQFLTMLICFWAF